MSRASNTRFAVAAHVLAYLAGLDGGRAASSEELSRSANVNPVYIRQVMGPLRAAGLVRSRPGVHGGWELALPAYQISLDWVWTLLQGSNPVLGLHGPDPDCATGRGVQTSLAELDRELADAIAARLRQVTVEQLLSAVRASSQ